MSFPWGEIEMDDRTKMAFDALTDVTKQLVTLSSGIITLTVLLSTNASPTSRPYLLWAWIFYLLSIFGGVWAMYAIVGTLANAAQPSPLGSNIRLPVGLQQ